MTHDFWNNPILVTAVRSKLRNGWSVQAIVLHPVLLFMAWVALPVLFPELERNWPRYSFIALMGLQFTVSGFMATTATSRALKSEVVNETLDFVRLTPLSPRQILLGMLLGESTLAFFLAIASFPVGILCWAVGGVSLPSLLLSYVNLILYVGACGSGGLVMHLEPREDKRVDANALALSGWAAGIPAVALLGMDEPWRTACLALLPLVLVVLTFINFHVMERALTSPFNTATSRIAAFVLLATADVAAVLAVQAFPLTVAERCVAYWTVNMVASAYLVVAVTPGRGALKTWVWRLRGRTTAWRDAWLGDRSPNGLAILTLAAIGLVVYALGILPLALVTDGTTEVVRVWPALAGTSILSVMLVIAYGCIVQWNALILGRVGTFLVLIFLGVLILPYVLAGMIDARSIVPWIAELSPVAHYVSWVSHPDTILRLFPALVFAYALVALLAARSFRARMGHYRQVVIRKLEKMGVKEIPAGNEAVSGNDS